MEFVVLFNISQWFASATLPALIDIDGVDKIIEATAGPTHSNLTAPWSSRILQDRFLSPS